MLKKILFRVQRLSILLAAFALVVACGATAGAQNTPPKDEKLPETEKAEQVIKSAIEAMGGSAYLGARTVVGKGLFTQYKDGQSGLPSSFVDYIVFPDKERTEFKSHEGKIIQTNAGDAGWIYDGASKTVKDMSKAQVEDFKRGMRSGFDNLLRGFWRGEGAKLSYVGRREAGLARRNEVVRLTYPDGYTVEFEFGARDSMPAKVLYRRTNADGEEAPEEDRMAQHVKVQGIIFPYVIDHYRAGIQTSRINYQSVEFNAAVPDTLFARPANAKAVK